MDAKCFQTTKEILEAYGFEVGDSGGGCKWAVREIDGGGYVVITDEGGLQIPETIDEPILIGVYDKNFEVEEKCEEWHYGLDSYLSTHWSE